MECGIHDLPDQLVVALSGQYSGPPRAIGEVKDYSCLVKGGRVGYWGTAAVLFC